MAEKSKLIFWKKILYAISILIVLAGSLCLLVFTFIINDTLDKTQFALVSNVDAIQNDLSSLDLVLSNAETEFNRTNTTLESMQISILSLSNGLNKTGKTFDSLASSLSSIPIIGSTIPSGDIQNASSSLIGSANELATVASQFDGHKTGVSDITLSLGGLRGSISSQMAGLQQTKKSVLDIFGLMKLANFLFFIVVVCMFGTITINSVAGII